MTGVHWHCPVSTADSCIYTIIVLTHLLVCIVSISSYGLKFAFSAGFLAAFLPQVVAAIVMCIICFRKYQCDSALRALILWVGACIMFLVLHAVEDVVPSECHKTTWFLPCLSVVTKMSDCTQIHFSIRFFVELSRQKKRLETASVLSTISVQKDTTALAMRL